MPRPPRLRALLDEARDHLGLDPRPTTNVPPVPSPILATRVERHGPSRSGRVARALLELGAVVLVSSIATFLAIAVAVYLAARILEAVQN